MNIFYYKYLKYKTKYLLLRGGSRLSDLSKSYTRDQLFTYFNINDIDKCFEEAKKNIKNKHCWMIAFSEEIIRRAIKEELKSNNPIWWRFSTDKYERNNYSFSKGLLSGFINDSRYSPKEGLSNFSACTLSYWINHQLITSKKWRENNNIVELNDTYQDYVDNKNNHKLYGILYEDHIDKIKIINLGTDHLKALYGSGENFHPKISIKDSFLPEDIFKSINIWTGDEDNFYETTNYMEP